MERLVLATRAAMSNTAVVVVDIEGVLDINTVGVILLVVGAIGLVLSLMFWSTWGGAAGTRRRTTYVEDGPSPY